MTANHSYNTPAKGTLDWHLLLNENFNRLERDVPVVDVEANRDTYVPYSGTMFIATDTGRRYVGDGETWSEIPYPDSTASTTDSTSSSTDTTTTANIRVSTSNGVTSATRDGSEFASGDADQVFDAVVDGLQDNDHVFIEAGDYEINTQKNNSGLVGVTWESEGSITLDDQGSPIPWMFGFLGFEDLTVIGGTYDYDASNNTDDGVYGTQANINIKRSTNVELKEMTLLNAEDMFIGGNDATFVTIHHNEMRSSGERGIYLSESASDIEVHNNIIRGVRSGALRSNEGPTRWYSHDNDIVMDPTNNSAVYLFEGGVNDIRIENDRAVIKSSGEILNMQWPGTENLGNRNVTITGGYYEGNPEKADWQEFADLQDTDLSTVSVSSTTEIVDLPISFPEIHE